MNNGSPKVSQWVVDTVALLCVVVLLGIIAWNTFYGMPTDVVVIGLLAAVVGAILKIRIGGKNA